MILNKTSSFLTSRRFPGTKRRRAPSKALCVQWMKECWEALPAVKSSRSLSVCVELSVNTDGTEDDDIHCDSRGNWFVHVRTCYSNMSRGYYFVRNVQRCGCYSRAATIRERHLFERIRYAQSSLCGELNSYPLSQQSGCWCH